MTTCINYANYGMNTNDAAITYNKASYKAAYDTGYIDTVDNYNQQYEGTSAKNGAIDSALNNRAETIVRLLESGQEDKALTEYEKLLAEMGQMDKYTETGISESDMLVREAARNIIESHIEEGNLEDLIRNKTMKEAARQNQAALTWGNCDQTSQEDLLLRMCDIEEEEHGGSIFVQAPAAIAGLFVGFFNWAFNGNQKM